ncbi:hypothetical protein SAMN05421820_114104 [Pedobacter steynii]|uniref:Uncharacterized protein n=1 Tax=Pedobacter steynii TaxID=430522 RepID=A0A1H0J7F2_9SPHI|nr:hypothetical protein SAMN05421820_114104 [Pedobacter steynii]
MNCAILLESLKQPFTRILLRPFSFIAVFLIFHFFNIQFEPGGYTSLFMLCGIVIRAKAMLILVTQFLLF